MSQIQSYLEVRIADQAVAMDIGAIRAVNLLVELMPVPLVSGAVAGLTTIRGRAVTVLDAARLVGRETAITPQTHFVVIRVGGFTYAVLVDAVEEVRNVDVSEIGPNPPSLAAEWQSLSGGMVWAGDRPLLVMRLDQLVESEMSQAA